jgi:predicted Zn-dependent protease
MEGRFDGTVIIMMGCSGIALTDLAEAFIDKGASVYVAWDRSVGLNYVDDATPYLIKQLCSEKLTIEEAVDNTMAAIGPDPEYGAELEYYYDPPSHNRDKTLEELIK